MTQDIFDKLFGDKAYISKALADLLWGNGIQMITKPRKNMKDFNISQADNTLAFINKGTRGTRAPAEDPIPNSSITN